MRRGILAAWPDPEDMPVQALWAVPDGALPSTPLALFRESALAYCDAWRLAAERDGWIVNPTYPGQEAVETAWTAERDGFKVQGIARALGHHGSRLPVAKLSIWGPDGLAIPPPPKYSMNAIIVGAQTCMSCECHPVATERVAFVGRYCAACAPAERLAQEYSGWCD